MCQYHVLFIIELLLKHASISILIPGTNPLRIKLFLKLPALQYTHSQTEEALSSAKNTRSWRNSQARHCGGKSIHDVLAWDPNFIADALITNPDMMAANWVVSFTLVFQAPDSVNLT